MGNSIVKEYRWRYVSIIAHQSVQQRKRVLQQQQQQQHSTDNKEALYGLVGTLLLQLGSWHWHVQVRT